MYYFYCNRTGKFTSKSKGVRSEKQQGTSKIGQYCTAYIRARQYKSGEVEAEICDHHTHVKQPAHLPISKPIRDMIAAKLQEGVSPSSIFDSIRDNVEGELGRRELINHQDICNIRHQYNIEGIKLNSNDAKSVFLWVQNLNDQCGNDKPIILYKPQETMPDEAQKDFNNDDFVLCIQTTFQSDMLKEFGPKAICMDSTHGTNVYDFKLVTILVLDEFGEGIPVGWMISNREDAIALTSFLRKIKEKCGDISTEVFMSDDAENFYNAWKCVFTVSNTKKLLCAWHVDRSWRKGLQKHIDATSEQAKIYHHLRVLLSETEINSFHLRLQQLVSWLSEKAELKSFLEYFQKEYCKRVEQWAPCYRVNCLVNTNMALEAFHRLLKVCYMEKKQNRRIDFLLHVLLKISRDKVFERFIKAQKGKSSYRICEINKRHKNAEKMLSSENILSRNGDTWIIQSSSFTQNNYSVQKQLEACSCKLRCKACDICVHQYMCTCIDYILHSTICKHIHLVNMSSETSSAPIAHLVEMPVQLTSQPSAQSQEQSIPVSTDITNADVVPPSDKEDHRDNDIHGTDIHAHESIEYLSRQVKISDTCTFKDKAVATCQNIEAALSTATSAEAVKSVQKHLDAALAILKGTPSQMIESFTTRKRVAPNTNSQPQARFHSTKKKRTKKEGVSKPSDEQLNQCLDDLKKAEITVCGICLKENDTQSSQTQQWIQCDKCDMWYHQSCAQVNTQDSDFCCRHCINPACNL